MTILELTCATCGKDFKRDPQSLTAKRRRNTRFCSKECVIGSHKSPLVLALLDYFERNPDEELTMQDICIKFSYTRSKAVAALNWSKQRGVFSIRQETRIMPKGNTMIINVWGRGK
jgi:hypothetical protein